MADLIAHVALVPFKPNALDAGELARVAAALQKQMTRDVGPLWNMDATVDAFPSLNEIPLGYWPIIIGDDQDVPDGAGGIHLDYDNQPYALVRLTSGWSITASHECIEMLVDPSGNRFIPGPSPAPDQGRVLFLLEACDPCESPDYAYTVNDVLVSDFYTPHYFDPQQAPGVRYDFTGHMQAPRQVLPGGYLSWRNPQDGQYYQLQDKDGNAQIIPLEGMERPRGSIREAIDHHEKTPKPIRFGVSQENRELQHAAKKMTMMKAATKRWAQDIQHNIEQCIKEQRHPELSHR